MEAKAKELATTATEKDDEMKDERIGKGQETLNILEVPIQNSDDKEQERDSTNKLEQDKKSSENTKKEQEEKKNDNDCNKKTTTVWDCGSTLYDSFELNSFKRQLDSAISARSMSMSRLPPPHVESSGGKKHTNKISRSLQRLMKSVFRQKQPQGLSQEKERYLVGSLTTIPESTTEINSSHVRRTVSERFSASRVVGISCA